MAVLRRDDERPVPRLWATYDEFTGWGICSNRPIRAWSVEVVPKIEVERLRERIAQADRFLRAAYADAHPEDVPVDVLLWLNPEA